MTASESRRSLTASFTVLMALLPAVASAQWSRLGQDLFGNSQWDRLGYSVALSSHGKRMAIGVNRSDEMGPDSGHVRVYSFGVFIDGSESGSTAAWSAAVP